jgi:hypothetical protein
MRQYFFRVLNYGRLLFILYTFAISCVPQISCIYRQLPYYRWAVILEVAVLRSTTYNR